MRDYSKEVIFDAEILNQGYFSIGITGKEHGAGSTSTSKELANVLGFGYKYAGAIYRRLIALHCTDSNKNDDEKMITILNHENSNLAFNARIDRGIGIAAIQGNVVFEGKAVVPLLKAGIIPARNGDVLKVPKGSALIYSYLLTCEPQESAIRALIRDFMKKNPGVILNDNEIDYLRNSFTENEIKTKMNLLSERMSTERYPWDNGPYKLKLLENGAGAFDLTIDSTHKSTEEIVKTIIRDLINRNVITAQNLNRFPNLSNLIS